MRTTTDFSLLIKTNVCECTEVSHRERPEPSPACCTSAQHRAPAGTSLSSVHTLVDTPTALAVFWADSALPRVPSVAIAAGPYVYVYRNLRPYLKFALPNLQLTVEEMQAWESLYRDEIPVQEAIRVFSELRDSDKRLSSRALDLIVLPPGQERTDLIEQTKGKPLVQQTVVTCMEVFYTEKEGHGEASTLLLGTESCTLVYLNSACTGVEDSLELPSVPVQIAVHGTKKGEHRINVLCRDGTVYAVRDRALLPTRLDAGAMPVGFVRTENDVVLATMDCRLTAFHPKGSKTWTVALPALPTAMCRMLIKRDRVHDCVAVACEGGLIRVFNGRQAVAELQAPETVVAIRYGQYARESNSLVFVTRSGALTFKMLRRTANFEPPPLRTLGPGGIPDVPDSDVPLPVPKKTRLYLEQVAREKEAPAEMHRAFQRDLVRLRYMVARNYVRSVNDGGISLLSADSATSGGEGSGSGPGKQRGGPPSLRLHASVQGLGPRFRLRLELVNTGMYPVPDLTVVTLFSPSFYACPTPVQHLPLLLPGLAHMLHIPLLCVDEGGAADVVRVHILPCGQPGSSQVGGAVARAGQQEKKDGGAALVVQATEAVTPVASATINMPMSQPPQPIG